MAKKEQISARILSVICGIVFVVSGFLKSIDSGAFARLLESYGIPYLEYAAPLIIIGETLLGMALVLGLWQRTMAVISLAILICFTFGYTYGFFLRDITDCGCFGPSSALSSSPVLLYVRNLLLILMLIYVIVKTPRTSSLLNFKKLLIGGTIVLLTACVVSFTCGRSFRRFHVNKNITANEGEPVNGTPLGELLTFHPDSTYLVFAFSYQCPHCMNSIANLDRYESQGAVDKVIAIGLGGKKSEARFKAEFNPHFRLITDKRVLNLTNEFPKTYYIRHDSIITSFTGELPCAKVFKASLGI